MKFSQLFCLSSLLLGCASPAVTELGSRCPAGEKTCLLTLKLPTEETIRANRNYIFEAMMAANLKFPQIDNGIILAGMSAFLERPIPTAILKLGAPEEIIDQQYEAMLKAHRAYGIKREVSRAQVERIAKNTFLLEFNIRNALKIIEPKLARDSNYKSDETLIDRYFFGADFDQSKAAKVGVRIRNVLESSGLETASRIYREKQRNRQGISENFAAQDELGKSLNEAIDAEFGSDAELAELCPLLRKFIF